MSDSPFNPDSFIDTEIQGALDTRLIPVPVGEWSAQIGEVQKPRVSTKDGEQFVFLEIPWKVTAPEVAQAVGRDLPIVRQSIRLDISQSGGLDMGKGKNVQLGQLREVFGLNDPSMPFSIRQLQGRGAVIKVSQRNDPRDASVVYTDAKPLRAMI